MGLFARNIQHKPPVDFHFLIVLFALKFEAVDILPCTHNLRAVKGSSIRISRKNLLTRRVRGQVRIDMWNGNERDSSGLINRSLLTVLIRLGILYIIPDGTRQSKPDTKITRNLPLLRPFA